jgi:hypothetical protein
MSKLKDHTMGAFKQSSLGDNQARSALLWVHALMHADVPATIENFKKGREQAVDIEEIVHVLCDEISFSPKHKKLLAAGAKLASEPNDNSFHDNAHFLEVFSTSLMLGYQDYMEGYIEKEQLTHLLCAALIHDYGHDGGSNNGVQFKLEDYAVDKAEPWFRKAGANEKDINLIRTLVRATDCSKSKDSAYAVHSPADHVKFHEEYTEKELPKELQALKNAGYINAAKTLLDADLSGSLIDVDLSVQNGHRLCDEVNMAFSPEGQIYFLELIAHKKMFSKQGDKHLTPHLKNVLNHYNLTSPKYTNPQEYN